jgi:GTP-binding protein
MLPAIALVGRPNVGKSTLFNRLTGTRDALVADYPGLTRDRLYGYSSYGGAPAIVIDTGGLSGEHDEMSRLMARQVELAVNEADVVIFLVEASVGLTSGDEVIADLLRRSGKQVQLAVNKAEGLPPEETAAEFWSLGMGEPQVVSATRGDRVRSLLDAALGLCPEAEADSSRVAVPSGARIAVIGRPNVGKSTLINRYIGEERLVATDEAGTTRDSIYVPIEFDGQPIVLVDTAGIRRRAKVEDGIEKFSVVKSLKAIEESDAVIILLDARESVTEQDISLIGLVLERGRALTIGINKWDGLSGEDRGKLRSELDRRLPFVDFVEQHYVSAKHGSNIYELLTSAINAADCAFREMPTSRLCQVLEDAVSAHPPPLVRGRRVKLSYANQGGRNPPIVVLHGNQTERLAGSYRRYLVNCFRKAFRLVGTPMRLQLVTSRNPYAGKRNRLTPRQERSRLRVQGRGKKKR